LSCDRAKKKLIEKTLSGVIKNEKIIQVQEKKLMMKSNEEKRALEKLGAINYNIEKSRVPCI
jgi:hypothetical protein